MTDKINDGGPAFPLQYEDRTTPGIRNTIVCDGISKRDWFAGMALQGMLSIPPTTQIGNEIHNNPRRLSEWSYAQADAMIAERERKV